MQYSIEAYKLIDIAALELRKIEDIFDEMDEEVRTQNKKYDELSIFYNMQYTKLWIIQEDIEKKQEKYK
jgi:hypothetical protein